MQTAEIEHLSQVLAAVHDATRDPVTWPAALEAACAYLDGAAANIFRQDPVVQSAMPFTPGTTIQTSLTVTPIST